MMIPSIYSILASVPTFGHRNDMRSGKSIHRKVKGYTESSKPNKRRAKIKASRKANLKNRK